MRYPSAKQTTFVLIIVAIASYFVFTYVTPYLTPKSIISTIVKFDHCPIDKPNVNSGMGGRAMLSNDGSSLVMQCADGTIIAWHENIKPVNLGTMTLFDAAKNQKIIPTDLFCPNAYNFTETVCKIGGGNDPSPFQKCTPQDISIKPIIKEDCEVVDHNVDRTAYILKDNVSGNFISVMGSRSSLGTPMASDGGVLLPRNGQSEKLVFITRKKLMSVSLESGKMETIAKFETINGLWQDAASDGSSVAFSDAYQLLVTTFDGAFMGSQDITLVSAYTIKGDEKWSISGEVKASESGFSSDDAIIHLIDGGKFAVFSRVSNQGSFEIIDIKNGHKVGVVSGWPIATSANSNKILIKSADGKFSLISWSQVDRWKDFWGR